MTLPIQQSRGIKQRKTVFYENEMYEICSKGAMNASLVLSQLMHTSVRIMVTDIEKKTTVSIYRERIKSFVESCISAYRKNSSILQSNIVHYLSKEIVGIFIMFIEKEDATKMSNAIIQSKTRSSGHVDLENSAIIEMANIISNSYTSVLSENTTENYVGDNSKVISFESFGLFMDAMLVNSKLDKEYVFFKNILIIEEHALKVPVLMGFSEQFFASQKDADINAK
jgi:chemotaxis protein CheY-P-specific phosphatase CheC